MLRALPRRHVRDALQNMDRHKQQVFVMKDVAAMTVRRRSDVLSQGARQVSADCNIVPCAGSISQPLTFSCPMQHIHVLQAGVDTNDINCTLYEPRGRGKMSEMSGHSKHWPESVSVMTNKILVRVSITNIESLCLFSITPGVERYRPSAPKQETCILRNAKNAITSRGKDVKPMHHIKAAFNSTPFAHACVFCVHNS